MGTSAPGPLSRAEIDEVHELALTTYMTRGYARDLVLECRGFAMTATQVHASGIPVGMLKWAIRQCLPAEKDDR